MFLCLGPGLLGGSSLGQGVTDSQVGVLACLLSGDAQVRGSWEWLLEEETECACSLPLITFSRPMWQGLLCASGPLTLPGGCLCVSFLKAGLRTPLLGLDTLLLGTLLVPPALWLWCWVVLSSCSWSLLLSGVGEFLALPSVHARRAVRLLRVHVEGDDVGLFSPQAELWPFPPGGSSGWLS